MLKIASFACSLVLASWLSYAQAKLSITSLKPGYGYLLVAVEAYGLAPSKILLKGNKFLTSTSVASLKLGNNYQLLALPAGEYTYNQIYNHQQLNSDTYWDILNHDYSIQVQADVISYGGHLVSSIDESYAEFLFRNRSSQAWAYINQCCSQLLRTNTFHYTGHYPDPFIEILKSSIAEQKP